MQMFGSVMMHQNDAVYMLLTGSSKGHTCKDGGDAEIGCDIVRNKAALGISCQGQLGVALHKGGTGHRAVVSVFEGLYSLPAGAFELPEHHISIGMPCQQQVALQISAALRISLVDKSC